MHQTKIRQVGRLGLSLVALVFALFLSCAMGSAPVSAAGLGLGAGVVSGSGTPGETVCIDDFESGKLNAWNNWRMRRAIVSPVAFAGQSALALGPQGGQVAREVPLQPNSLYRLSAYVRTESGAEEVQVSVSGYGGVARSISSALTEYRQVSIEFTSARSATKCMVMLKHRGQGRGYFDQIELTRLGEAPPLVVQQFVQPEPRALQSEGGFAQQSDETMRWFNDAKFGLFIHWGVYAAMDEGNEWVMHNKAFTPDYYRARAESPETGFTADKFDPAAWAQMAKQAGMKYLVLTTRHHDGYALFDSKHPNSWTSVKHLGRDLIREYVDAVRASGLHVGLYYSPMSWRYPGYYNVTGDQMKPNVWGYTAEPSHRENARVMKEEVYEQVTRLLSDYGPIEYMFWDGAWLGQQGNAELEDRFWDTGKYQNPSSEWPVDPAYHVRDPNNGQPFGIMGLVRHFQPQLIVNERFSWIGDVHAEEGGAAMAGDIRHGQPTEKCLSLMMGGWGYYPNRPVIPFEEVAVYLSDCVVRNVNLLLNVAPDRHGVVPENQQAVLRQIGGWLGKVGDAVHGTRGGPWQPQYGEYGFTWRDNKIYAHIYAGYIGRESGAFVTQALGARKVVAVRDLLGGESLAWKAQPDGTVRIEGVNYARMPSVTVLEITLDDDVYAQVAPAAEEFAYRLKSASGTKTTPTQDGLRGEGAGGFRLLLEPTQGEAWDMSGVSLLATEFRNLGRSDLVLDLRLDNEGATDWGKSSAARVIVRAGETYPLVLGMPRAGTRGERHPAFLRMSGRPDGTYRHWHNIDASRVLSLSIRGEAAGPHQFELGRMTTARPVRPEMLEKFPFIDRYGQYVHADWPGKIRTDEDLKRAVAEEAAWAKRLGVIPERGRFGGWTGGPRREATGRFRVEQVDGRWWFVDPEGYLFWSHGATGVGFGGLGSTPLDRDPRVFAELPATDDAEFGAFFSGRVEPSVHRPQGGPAAYAFGQANLFRKYGRDWAQVAARRETERALYVGLNTLAAWSSPGIQAAGRVPYTAMIHFGGAMAADKLPDPFDPRTREALRSALRDHPVPFRDDPYCIGAFINNELHWTGSAPKLVTEILRHTDQPTAAKRAVRDWLREKHGSVEAFNAAWGTQVTAWDDLLGGLANIELAGMAAADASALATFIGDRYYAMVAEELEAYAPDVLNLGSRMHTTAPEVLAASARHVDVISTNLYSFDPAVPLHGKHGKPVIIGEYHFGNLTGRNLGSGLRSAQDATQQARLFRRYLERAAADPAIIGAHWFQWRDQSVGGRPDGENYDIGFFDVTDQPKRELIEASVAVSRELYRLRRSAK